MGEYRFESIISISYRNDDEKKYLDIEGIGVDSVSGERKIVLIVTEYTESSVYFKDIGTIDQ